MNPGYFPKKKSDTAGELVLADTFFLLTLDDPEETGWSRGLITPPGYIRTVLREEKIEDISFQSFLKMVFFLFFLLLYPSLLPPSHTQPPRPVTALLQPQGKGGSWSTQAEVQGGKRKKGRAFWKAAGGNPWLSATTVLSSPLLGSCCEAFLWGETPLRGAQWSGGSSEKCSGRTFLIT